MEMNIGDVLKDEDLKNHTTFKIGGPCDLMLLPKSYENVRDIVKYLRDEDIPFMVLGNGSNLLVKDSGLRKVVIKIADNLSNIRLDGNKIVAQAGAQLTTTSKFAIENSLEGMEFSSGIPGNIGGAITMNAGAYGGEMKDIVSSVKVIDINNEIRDFSCEQMHFGYRKSRVQEEGLIVLEAIFELNHGNYEEIYAKYKDFHDRRNSKQPLDYPSAGSVFKRPEGYYAGKLIEDSGLRGYRYKNAMVSEKHCGFIVTDGESSYEEVSKVIEHVKEVVYEKFGVKLETEIKIIGD
ncbi:MAG: UDP-N-acetylmuramate dehydrogenase [Tissierellia bacterium]|nr:UDP-N-acetylmuramate dehydrogenase [Tissierellia bacterium]